MGKPRVNYLEAITKRVEFDYLHKKQTGAKRLHVTHCIDGSTIIHLDKGLQQSEWVLMITRWPGAVWAGDRLHGAAA